jgi:hypothetical protein
MASMDSALVSQERPANIDPALFEDSKPLLPENSLVNQSTGDVDMLAPDSGMSQIKGEAPQKEEKDEEMVDLFGTEDVEEVQPDG